MTEETNWQSFSDICAKKRLNRDKAIPLQAMQEFPQSFYQKEPLSLFGDISHGHLSAICFLIEKCIRRRRIIPTEIN
jgi:hypothetical protein